MNRMAIGHKWPGTEIFAVTWLPTCLAVGLTQAFHLGVWFAVIGLITAPITWWLVTRSNVLSIRRAALAGAAIAAILCAVPTAWFVQQLARHGPGEELGAFVTVYVVMMIPVVWAGSLIGGAVCGALIGVTYRLAGIQPPSAPELPSTTIVKSQDTADRVRDVRQSRMSRWLDRGERRAFLKVIGVVLILPLALVAAIGYVRLEWKRTEVRDAGATAVFPHSPHLVAAEFRLRYRWSHWPHRHEVRLSPSWKEFSRGRVVWESSQVPIRRLEWPTPDSLLVHVDLRDRAPSTMRSIKTHSTRQVVVRTVLD